MRIVYYNNNNIYVCVIMAIMFRYNKLKIVYVIFFIFQFPPKPYDGIANALEDHCCSESASSMVLKLLETNPQCRLKSLRRIRHQPFFHGFDFSSVESKNVKTIACFFRTRTLLRRTIGDYPIRSVVYTCINSVCVSFSARTERNVK